MTKPALRMFGVLCVVSPLSYGQQLTDVRAQVVANANAAIAAGISSTVSRVPVREGGVVKKGSPLVAFDCAILKAQSKVAKARLKAANAALTSNRDMLKYNSIGPLEVTISEAERDIAAGEYEASAANRQYCTVRAPYDLVVVKRHVNPQEYINKGEPLLDVYALQGIEVKAVVSSAWLKWMQPNKSQFDIVIDELGKRYQGKLKRIGGVVDPVSQTVEIYGQLNASKNAEKGARLLPGMSGTITFNDQPR